MTSEIPTFLIGRSGLCRRLELSVQKKAMDRTETRFRKRGKIMGKITTSRQPHPQDEQSPQRSTSGYPLQEVVDDEVSGPSAPGVDHSPPGRSLCWKRKREWPDESEESSSEEPQKEPAPEPEETWVVETLCGLKMKLKRRRVSLVLPEHHEAFNRLLEDPVIKRFLAWDKDLRVSDKYLLAMVIAYFSRAGLPSWQYQRIHFFLALYLANDMEEDDEAAKQNIFYFLYGKTRSHIPLFHKRRFQLCRSMNWRARKNRSQIALFQELRFQFFCSMRCRAWVSPEELEEIQAYDPEHWVWARDRARLS
ncbi:putative speedy protein E7 isoform X3 [Hylobates moloch]|uniref:putative speedy protein E7 isoform X3 n=1 Tax=Hylobates moloch TaxID=81572 RepID=UPI002675D1F3|nr:putative speedy protein E7 isoform X3 [Hylobates moloch]